MAKDTVREAKIKITKREEDFSRWYTDVIFAGQLADYSPVKGCMVIRPNGYALWENIQRILDEKIKETGHENAYFPLFIPEEFLRREAEHVEGFSPELAVVTYAGGKELDEKLVVRPTSETIMYDSYSKWIRSYRDLPLLINQWANVVRWEMRTRLFLRTTEFLWQEGHTAHATHEEALEEVFKMLNVYKEFVEEYLAIPVLAGVKSQKEKFAGALNTYSIEGMMQDKKALQCGTSHDLGQNFAKAFDITFQDKDGKLKYVWQTSWGVSTRLIGAVIMTHGDDRGIIMPPAVAPIKAVFVPIWKDDETMEKTIEACKELKKKLQGISVKEDYRDNYKPAWKFYEWERKGVPIRIELGPRDLESQQVVLVRRDTGEKIFASWDSLRESVENLLKEIQKNLFQRALDFRKKNTYFVNEWKEFENTLKEKGGFIEAYWCGDTQCETSIKEKTTASIRVILKENTNLGRCVHCGKEGKHKVVFAKAY